MAQPLVDAMGPEAVLYLQYAVHAAFVLLVLAASYPLPLSTAVVVAVLALVTQPLQVLVRIHAYDDQDVDVPYEVLTFIKQLLVVGFGALPVLFFRVSDATQHWALGRVAYGALTVNLLWTLVYESQYATFCAYVQPVNVVLACTALAVRFFHAERGGFAPLRKVGGPRGIPIFTATPLSWVVPYTAWSVIFASTYIDGDAISQAFAFWMGMFAQMWLVDRAGARPGALPGLNPGYHWLFPRAVALGAYASTAPLARLTGYLAPRLTCSPAITVAAALTAVLFATDLAIAVYDRVRLPSSRVHELV